MRFLFLFPFVSALFRFNLPSPGLTSLAQGCHANIFLFWGRTRLGFYDIVLSGSMLNQIRWLCLHEMGPTLRPPFASGFHCSGIASLLSQLDPITGRAVPTQRCQK